MKEIILTCPFTGVNFTATEYADGRIVFVHPITRKIVYMSYNACIDKYYIDKVSFKRIDTVTQAQAMEILDISRQRVNKIVHDGTIPAYKINGSDVFVKSDVLKYKESRKRGKHEKR